jgi:hypothetical protein
MEMDVREAIDSQGDLHNNSVAHPLETLGPRLFPAANGGGPKASSTAGVQKKNGRGQAFPRKTGGRLCFWCFV